MLCFAPGCNHQSSESTCKFRTFPKDVKLLKKWIKAVRRLDRKPNANSRICSCHFSGINTLPVIFDAHDVVIPSEDHSYCLYKVKCRKKKIAPLPMDGEPLTTDDEEEEEEEGAPLTMDTEEEGAAELMADEEEKPLTMDLHQGVSQLMFEEELQSERRKRIQLEIELEQARVELRFLQDKRSYCRDRYSAAHLSESVLRMETGLQDKDTFSAVCEYVARFESSITYYAGWKPKELILEDQIFMTLMKLRHNYPVLHLAALFHCSETTVRNVSKTFIEAFHRLRVPMALSNPCGKS